ncbi:MAG: hypothetical protein RBT02_03085 [Bacteroidales bacterium]|jgi:hypothetical protein|nr:hypothetical protein [Bacteroidales bacterium]
MKRALLLILTVLTASCGSLKKASSDIQDGDLVITRRYVGDYIDHRQTGPENYDGPNIIWIKTSMEDRYGIISAYGKKCDFTEGDRLYLRRIFYSPGIVSGYWVYYIENDASVSYRATDLQHDREVYIKSWFE